MTIQLTIS